MEVKGISAKLFDQMKIVSCRMQYQLSAHDGNQNPKAKLSPPFSGARGKFPCRS